MSTSTTTTPLPYADPASRAGISVQRDERSLRISFPPPRVTQLSGWLLFGLIFAGAPCVAFVGMLIETHGARGDLGELIANISIYAGAFLLFIWYGLRRLRTRTVLEVTESALRCIDVRGKHERIQSWRRDKVQEVRRNRSSNALMIHVTGLEMIEIALRIKPQLVDYVAEQINEGLRTIPFNPTDVVPAPISGISDFTRRVLLVLGTMILIAGVPLLFVGEFALLYMYVVVLAAPFFGIALGTQRKEYYYF